MRRAGLLLLAAAVLVATTVPDASEARKKPRRGVFGTINGKKFKATNLQGATDPCVNGIFRPNEKIIVFAALECRAKRRRQGLATKRKYEILVMACGEFSGNTSTTPPYEIPCPNSGYSEVKAGRFGQPLSMTQWGASADLVGTVLTSNVRMRIDAFDGTNVRGAISGVFEVPIQGNATPPAAIAGEVQFDFPFKIE